MGGQGAMARTRGQSPQPRYARNCSAFGATRPQSGNSPAFAPPAAARYLACLLKQGYRLTMIDTLIERWPARPWL
jgi:hypothetical protein